MVFLETLCKQDREKRIYVKKIFVADTSEVFCKTLMSALGADYEGCFCEDGFRAMKMLKEFQPQILVTDMTLPGVDGLTLLRTAAELPNRPVLLVTSRIYTPFIEAALEQIGVDYIMRKPCDIHCLAERILELSRTGQEPQYAICPAVGADALLQALKLNPCRDGYGYLGQIVEMYLQNSHRSLTKDLYPAAGMARHTSGLAVERAIRGVIEDAWIHRDEAVWRQYFAADRQGHVARPTNKEFIVAVAMAMAMQGQQRRWA